MFATQINSSSPETCKPSKGCKKFNIVFTYSNERRTWSPCFVLCYLILCFLYTTVPPVSRHCCCLSAESTLRPGLMVMRRLRLGWEQSTVFVWQGPKAVWDVQWSYHEGSNVFETVIKTIWTHFRVSSNLLWKSTFWVFWMSLTPSVGLPLTFIGVNS